MTAANLTVLMGVGASSDFRIAASAAVGSYWGEGSERAQIASGSCSSGGNPIRVELS